MASSPASEWVTPGPPDDRCRAELAAVLGSDEFKRSPKLSRFLAYLCEKQLEGRAGDINEYGIALDVLGRRTGFDPQQDAAVRVDAHHLRKRLKQYYAGAGLDHELQIVIPSGQYVPRFLPRAELARTVEKEPEVARRPGHTVRKWGIAVALALAVLAGWLFGAAGRGRFAGGPVRSTVGATLGVTRVAAEIRIAAGDRSSDYTDAAGRTWWSDRFFTGGEPFERGPVSIFRTQDPELFRSGREGQFVYNIPLSPGIYELHLYFAETSVASDALRSITVAMNGLPATSVDVASDAGGVNTATVKIFKDVAPDKDGSLHLAFLGTGPSFLNALEILPGTPGKMRPIRLAACDRIYRDHLGSIWMPDHCSTGGRTSARIVPIEATSDPDLYQSYRVGHFSYSIPVIEGGHYTVKFHFAETWFGSSNSAGGIGSRVFDVYCNGTTLLKNFDILKDSGGVGGRAVVRVFRNVPASPQGKLDLTFMPVVNFALVNAIEVTEE